MNDSRRSSRPSSTDRSISSSTTLHTNTVPTVASFETLFPRLRPGGLYLIEDWRWGVVVPDSHPPLAQIAVDLLAVRARTDLVEDITIDAGWITVRRGTRHPRRAVPTRARQARLICAAALVAQSHARSFHDLEIGKRRELQCQRTGDGQESRSASPTYIRRVSTSRRRRRAAGPTPRRGSRSTPRSRAGSFVPRRVCRDQSSRHHRSAATPRSRWRWLHRPATVRHQAAGHDRARGVSTPP